MTAPLSRITIPHFLGTFGTEAEAECAYRAAAINLFGNFARVGS